LSDCHYPPPLNEIVEEWKCGNNNKKKVYVCHIPPGDPANAHTICVSYNALAAHIAHGDYLGPCGNASCGNARGGSGAEDREQTVTATVLLHPNPASSEAWLYLSALEGSACSVRLFDVRGVLVQEINIAEMSQEPLRLDLSNLAAGLYFVHLQPEGERPEMVKLAVESRE
jgi:hypothetical protein